MHVYACECMQRHLNGVQEVASSNLAAPIGLSDGSVDDYGRVVFLVICNSDRNSDKHCLLLSNPQRPYLPLPAFYRETTGRAPPETGTRDWQ